MSILCMSLLYLKTKCWYDWLLILKKTKKTKHSSWLLEFHSSICRTSSCCSWCIGISLVVMAPHHLSYPLHNHLSRTPLTLLHVWLLCMVRSLLSMLRSLLWWHLRLLCTNLWTHSSMLCWLLSLLLWRWRWLCKVLVEVLLRCISVCLLWSGIQGKKESKGICVSFILFLVV